LLILVIALAIMALVALPHVRSGSRILTPGGERAVGQALEQAKQRPVAAVGGTWRGIVLISRALLAARRRLVLAWQPVSALLHESMDRLEAKSSSGRNVSAETPAGHGYPVVPEEYYVTPRDISVDAIPGETLIIPAVPPLPPVPYIPARPPAAPATRARQPAAEEPVAAPAAGTAAQPPAEVRRSTPSRRPVPNGPRRERFDVAAIIGNRPVGPPRPVPPESGPISKPAVTGSGRSAPDAEAAPAAPVQQPAAEAQPADRPTGAQGEQPDQVIDLRAQEGALPEREAQVAGQGGG
jgi:hypothetical protein